MKRLILYLTLLSVLPVLTGCQREENVRIQGVYYECIGENEIGLPYNSMAMYGYSSLYYDDRIYISSICDGYNIPTDVFGDEIKTVYGNRDVYWSDEEDKLDEITCEGTLYQVKGYDDNFRVAVYYNLSNSEDSDNYLVRIYDNLSGITLYSGGEMFDEKFHLSDSVNIEAGRYGAEERRVLSMEDEKVKSFLNALYDGLFMDPKAEDYPKLDIEEAYILSFRDANGLPADIAVYKEGYISFIDRGLDKMIVKADASACENIISD